MPIQPQADILRRSDGSIHIEAYARRATILHRQARAEALALLAAALGRAARLPGREVARPSRRARTG